MRIVRALGWLIFLLVASSSAPRLAGAQAIDPCLVGTWEAKTVTVLRAPGIGGEGFQVTVTADGTLSIDYSATKLWTTGDSRNRVEYRGTARAQIATVNNTARIVRIEKSDVTRTITWGDVVTKDLLTANLGPGGLGNTARDNGYVCRGDSLEYKTSGAVDRSPTHSIKLMRSGTKGHDMAGRYPEEGP